MINRFTIYSRVILTLSLFVILSVTTFAQKSNVKGTLDYTSMARITGTAEGTTVAYTNPYTSQPASHFAGAFNGTLNSQAEKFYCIDLQHYLVYNEDYWDESSTPSEITYILNNYFPYKTSYPNKLTDLNKEAAAIQFAIWHFSDGNDANTITNDATIKSRALAIIADASTNHNNVVILQSLVFVPAAQSLTEGTAASFDVYAYDLDGNPVSNLSITLTTTLGTLSATSATTDLSGRVGPITLTYSGIGTATIGAKAKVEIPQGTRYVHKALPGEKQKLVLATPSFDNKEVYATVTWYTPSDPGTCDTKGFTTFTQGGWGGPSNSTPGKIRDLYFSTVFPTGLTVGGTLKLTLTSAEAVKNYLPDGGTAAAYTQNYTDPTTAINVLSGQLTALKLNVYYDAAGKIGSNSTNLGDLVIAKDDFTGMLVSDFLAFAESAIGGGPLNGYTFSQINDAATAINENFDNGTVDKHFLSCADLVCKNTLGDFVWHDKNYNGIQDANEPGIKDVAVELIFNGNVIATSTTDITGKYSFTNLSNGTYSVRVAASNYSNGGVLFSTAQTKWYASPKNQGSDDSKDSDADKNESVSVTLNCNNNATVDFGFFKTCVSVVKTADKATANPGDVITYTFTVENCGDVTLSGGVDLYDALINPVGDHKIGNLTPVNPGTTKSLTKTYTVKDTDCGQLVNTVKAIGHPINGSANVEFEASVTTEIICKASIGDKVWNDINKDGIQDANEPGIADVTVKLYTCSDVLVATTTTDANGFYSFTNLTPGDYYVLFTAPAGYTITLKDAGTDDSKDSDVDAATGKTVCTTLVANENDVTWDAGMYVTPVEPANIGNKVWNDINKDGVQDAGEIGIASVVVNLYSCDDTFISTTTTDADGIYHFTNLTPGDYYVVFVLPSGYTFSPADQGGNDAKDSDANATTGKAICTTLTPGETDNTWDAGMYVTPPVVGSLGDKVWLDTNKDGIQNNNEVGKEGVTVKLFTCAGALVGTTTTDASGNYLFSNLAAGDYYVQFVVPSGYTVSPALQGGNTALDSNPDATGITSCITLAAGENNLTIDAGLYLTPVIEKADIKIEKTVDNPNPQCDDLVTFTIKATNLGPNTANDVQVTDLLPSGLDYVSNTASQGSYISTTGIWTIGTLANGANATLTIKVKVDCGQVNNSVFDLGIAKDFNLFVIEDANQPSSDTQGKVAVGHNATFANYSIGDQLPANSGDVLIVGNDLNFISGAIYNGNVVYGHATNLPQSGVSITGGTLRHDSPINFATAKAYLENLSTTLSTSAVNGTTAFQYGGLTLTGTDPFLNVFAVNGSNLSSANNVSITAPNGSVVLVNISGTTLTWTGGLVVNGTATTNVLFNFYQATSLTIQGIDITGSVLAPFADLNFASGVINGQMICKSLTGMGQFNNVVFGGQIPVNENITNIAFISGSSLLDPNPGNNSSSATITINGTNNGGNNGGNTGGNNGGNGGGTWTNVCSFGPGEIVYTLAYSNSAIFAGTWGGKIYQSTNGGTSWTVINAGMNVSFIWSLNISGGVIFAATEQGVYKYNGSTWVLTSLAGKDVHSIVSYNGTIYAATWGFGIYKSVNGGTSWTQINNGLGAFLAVQTLTVASNGDVFAGTAGGGIYKCTDSLNWTKITCGYQSIWSMSSTSSAIFAGTYGDGLYRSLDGGMSFTKTSLDITFVYSIAVDLTGKIFVSSLTNGVYVSSDNGSTWSSLGMGGFGVSAMMVNPNSSDVYVGTKEGQVFMISSNSSVTDVDDNSVLPKEYELAQNYPNPFNPSTTIQFVVPEAGMYSLKVYNVLGEEVANLIENQLASGLHKVTFDASKLTSGMYIYRLSGNKVNISKKMILMK